MSRHPELNDSIHELLATLREPVQQQAIEGLIVVLLGPDNRAIEQYEFELDVAAPEEIPATYRCES